MALRANTHWQFFDNATANMVNGGGFAIDNTNFLADATTDSNTANTDDPILSSASYNFVAGDVDAWVYIQSGTNWTPGFYKISAVASNKATLMAAVGEAVQFNSTTGDWGANTVAGCATVGTPTSGTFGIDYSQTTAAIITDTDLACADGDAASPVVTSAAKPFGVNHVGNIIHVTAGTGYTADWYEIVSVSGVNATLDRAVGTDGAKTGGTFYVGGAMSLNSTLDDEFYEAVPAGSMIWYKNGTYTTGEAISVSSTNGTIANPIVHIGYNSLRGDNPIGSTRPTIAAGANAFALGQDNRIIYLNFTTTESVGISSGARFTVAYCKILNTSTTASRAAIRPLSVDHRFVFNEFISQNGSAMSVFGGTKTRVFGNYAHDSVSGYISDQPDTFIINNIFARNTSAGITLSQPAARSLILNNTLYGRDAKIGTGINLSGSGSGTNCIGNNIMYGCTTGLSVSTSYSKNNLSFANDFYNNTADVSVWIKSSTDLALDPQFTDVTEITGTTATTSGSVLTDGGADFSTVEDNVDFLHVTSGTGVTTGCYLITGHTGTTLTTNNALGTSSAGNVVYWLGTGHDYSIGTNLKAQGFPGPFYGSATTGYMDIGAVQRQEAGGGSGGSFTFVG